MKIAVPDIVSNSYFPVLAAAELGLFEAEGVDLAVEHVFPVDRAYAALRDGAVDFVATSAHATVSAFPEWRGAKLLCAQAQGMYWFLVMRAGLGAARGALEVVKGRRIAAAAWVDVALRRLLAEAGIDTERDGVRIAPVSAAPGESFGVAAARALEAGAIDGFFANGMAAALAVGRGVGTIVLDVRRGDGPTGCFNYTMASIATTDRLIDQQPDAAVAVVRAIGGSHQALREDLTRATAVGRKLFPPAEADLIAPLIARDLPFYDRTISAAFVADMNRFARAAGILAGDVPYEDVVATRFRYLWSTP
jgi:ABC-type nitrate/sulfonate/bicarbonate transport system substrate-binding protein